MCRRDEQEQQPERDEQKAEIAQRERLGVWVHCALTPSQVGIIEPDARLQRLMQFAGVLKRRRQSTASGRGDGHFEKVFSVMALPSASCSATTTLPDLIVN